MMAKTLRLGTRGSDLARWQTDHVAALLRHAYPNVKTEIVVISTRGDQVLDTPLPLVGGKGLFTAELESALRNGTIDLAVHSLKDLPTENPEGLTVGAIPARENPADILVSRDQYTLETLPHGAIIGTSSHRRAAQLLHLRPDLKMRDIRGNINTRIRKGLDPDGDYDAIVLAYAGVHRLKMLDIPHTVFPFEQMLPAPGQGALGVQCRDDSDSKRLLTSITDPVTVHAVTAERAFLAGLGGGCSVPVAAYAALQDNGHYHLQGRVISTDGQRRIHVESTFNSVDVVDVVKAQQAGDQLAREAIVQGADKILGLTQ